VVANDFLALIVFLAAAATDLLDGYLARRWKQVTTVGTLLDPVADKLLISAALVSLVQIRLLPGWMAILIISREFAVSGLRSIAAAEGYTIKAGELGKSKMMLQVVGVALVIFGVASAVDYFRKFWGKVDTSIKQRRRHELLTMERQKRRIDRAAKREGRPTKKNNRLSDSSIPTIRRSG